MNLALIAYTVFVGATTLAGHYAWHLIGVWRMSRGVVSRTGHECRHPETCAVTEFENDVRDAHAQLQVDLLLHIVVTVLTAFLTLVFGLLTVGQ